MIARFLYVFTCVGLLYACAGTVADYEKKATYLIQRCDTTDLMLTHLDTAEMTVLLQDARMNIIDFKSNLGTDTLDLETARELDAFVRTYKMNKSFKVDWSKAKQANDSLKLRLAILVEDIKAGSGDRSGYALALKTETKEFKAIRRHASYLDSINRAFNEAYLQFKPIFERYLRQEAP